MKEAVAGSRREVIALKQENARLRKLVDITEGVNHSKSLFEDGSYDRKSVQALGPYKFIGRCVHCQIFLALWQININEKTRRLLYQCHLIQ